MTGSLAKCPNPQCRCPVQPADTFCAGCGQALEPVAGGEEARIPEFPALENSPALTDALAPQGSLADQLVTSLEALVTGAGSEVGLPVNRPAAQADTVGAPPTEVATPNDCPDLEVRYNNSCVFVLNMQSTFDFEIRPLTDGIKGLFVEVRQSGQVIARETPMVLPRRGTPITFGLNYTPRNTHAGKVSFTIVVGYRMGQQQRVYAAYRTHTIHSGKEDPRRVCESLVVEVKNNIQQGHAGDLRVDQSFNGLREALRERSTIAVDKEFLDLINARSFWTTLALAECADDSVPGFGPGPAPKIIRSLQLELRAPDGLSLYLLAQTSIRIGRRRDCEILARARDAAGQDLRAESLRISQYHALIEWAGEHCVLKDGGLYPDKGWCASKAGVWIDGKRIATDGEFTFAPGREYRLTLAEPTAEVPATFELAARLWLVKDLPRMRPGCPDRDATPDAPACLAVRRLGEPRLGYLLLRQGASLAWAEPRCGGACACVRQGGLHFSDGHSCDWLVPGRTIRTGTVDFQVLELPTA